MSIITRGLGGTHLITQGYGYSIIIIPVEVGQKGAVVREARAYQVERIFLFIVKSLRITTKVTKDFYVKALDVMKYNRVFEIVDSLNITSKSTDFQYFIEVLKMILAQGIEFKSDPLNLIKPVTDSSIINEFRINSSLQGDMVKIDMLKIFGEVQNVFVLNSLDIVRLIEFNVLTNIKDIRILNLKQIKEYLELLQLLNELSED